VVLVVDAADAAQFLDRALVVQVAYQRVAGVGRQRDDAAAMDDLRGLLDQARLRILGVDVKELAQVFISGLALQGLQGGNPLLHRRVGGEQRAPAGVAA
jgi:hypothetical protein